MYLAMYKGPARGFFHRVAHEVTCLWTNSEYSHCELVFNLKSSGKSLCASASARDGGVRFKQIDLTSGRWDVYRLEGYTEEDEDRAFQWFLDHEGMPYDWLGLLWFVLPIDAFNNPRRFVCSEADAAALGMARPHKFHPQRLLDAVLLKA